MFISFECQNRNLTLNFETKVISTGLACLEIFGFGLSGKWIFYYDKVFNL